MNIIADIKTMESESFQRRCPKKLRHFGNKIIFTLASEITLYEGYCGCFMTNRDKKRLPILLLL
jgi:hypothetical protein